MRDYEQWHRNYEDPTSALSWRLRTVQRFIHQALDERPGPVRILSACAGDGRDVLGVLAERADAARVNATLVELHPALARQATRAATGTAARVEVRERDAGSTEVYVDVAPADLVMLVGVFGNISDDDVASTIAACPQLCRPGAVVLWTRGRSRRDINAFVRREFIANGFSELDYTTLDTGSCPAVGTMRFDGPAVPLVPAQRLFTFVR